jgi:carboxypeptidase PM20D1
MKRIFIGIATLLLVVFAVMVARTLMIAAPSDQAAAPPIPVESNAVAQHLAQAVRFQTISYGDGIKENEKTMALQAMHDWMEQTYPYFHEAAGPERVFSSLGSARTRTCRR